MTLPIRQILVAVKDTRTRSLATLRKAAQLARALEARVELFHAITDPVAVDVLTLGNQSLDKFGKGERQRHLDRLEKLAKPLRRGGLTVTTAAEWDHPVHEAVIRRARRIRASLIVAERHATRHVAPWLLRYADWELLRQSPVPVLLVKTTRPYKAPKVLAPVDPSHALDKSARLDRQILTLGARISDATGGQLHVMHAYLPSLVDTSQVELVAPDATAQILNHAAQQASKRLDKTLQAAKLGKLKAERRHLLAQSPADAIARVVDKLRCDIVVMGNISRSGLKRLALGNTAERLLDELPCDVLVVKPPGFATQVEPRPRGPQYVTLAPPSRLL